QAKRRCLAALQRTPAMSTLLRPKDAVCRSGTGTGFRLSLGVLCVLVVNPLRAAGPVRLTRDGSFKQHLQWSPDGKKFLFTRIHQGKMALWTMNADGTGLKRLVTADTPHFYGHCSTDSKKIVY